MGKIIIKINIHKLKGFNMKLDEKIIGSNPYNVILHIVFWQPIKLSLRKMKECTRTYKNKPMKGIPILPTGTDSNSKSN